MDSTRLRELRAGRRVSLEKLAEDNRKVDCSIVQ